MKIKELIAKLNEFDPEQSIACYSEDEGLRSSEGTIQIFEIQGVTKVDAESNRLNDGIGKPWLRFARSEKSSKFVLIDITSDV